MLSDGCGLTIQSTKAAIRGFVGCVNITSDKCGLTGAVGMSSLESTISISSLYLIWHIISSYLYRRKITHRQKKQKQKKLYN